MRDRLLRNALAYSLPELCWGFAWTIALDNPMPAAFAKGFGGSEGLVGTFMLCVAVGLALPILFSDYLVAPFKRKRTLLFWGHILPALGIVSMGVGIHLVQDLDSAWTHVIYLGGSIFFFVAIGAQIPLWLGLVGDLFPDGMRARVLGIAFAFNRGAAVFGGFVAQWILDADWSPYDQWTLLLVLSGSAMLLGCVPYLWLVEDPRVPRRRPALRTYFGHLRSSWRALPDLRRFVRADMLGVAIFVVIAFYGDAAIRAHGAHESWAGRWLRSYSAIQIPIALLISLLGDRVTTRTWLVVGSFAAAAAGVVGSIVEEPAAFHAVAALLGIYIVIRMSCHGPEVMRLAGDGDATIPIALSWALVVPIQGILPFLAGEAAIPTIGYGPIFLGAAVLSVVCGLLWAFDPAARRRSRPPQAPPAP
ncbi:MAG: MFS transporter [Planctomycetota bacterium]|nr:MFS transporter [Planctomycetota bacterium]